MEIAGKHWPQGGGLMLISDDKNNTKEISLPNERLRELMSNPLFFVLPEDTEPRKHSENIDTLIGHKVNRIERSLMEAYVPYFKEEEENSEIKHYKGTQTWIGLDPQALQTPYSDIHGALSLVQKYDPRTIIDLGAGYGRVGVVVEALLPDAEFIGYEILDERIEEANRIFKYLKLSNCEMRKQNVLLDTFELPEADVYFIYDFSDPDDVQVILKQLSARIYRDRFFLIARGKGIRSLIQVKFPEFWAAHGAKHENEWSLYSSFCDLV